MVISSRRNEDIGISFGLFSFFSPSRMADGYIISSVSLLYPSVLKTVYEVASTGEFSRHDSVKKITEVVPVFSPIVMTTHNKNNVPAYFQQAIDHIVELENYTEDQLQLIILQRLKYCGLDYAEERVLQLVVEYWQEKLHDMVRLLKGAIEKWYERISNNCSVGVSAL